MLLIHFSLEKVLMQQNRARSSDVFKRKCKRLVLTEYIFIHFVIVLLHV